MKVQHSIKIPDRVSIGDDVKAKDHNAVLEALGKIIKLALSSRTQPSADIGVSRSESGGQTLFLKKKARGNGVPDSPPCPFGKIIDVDDATYTKAIDGGAMLCGDKNFNVPFRGIDLETDSWKLIQITLSGIEHATDDDDEIFLSGVTTASGTPTWGVVSYSGSESYTPNTNPGEPGETGTIVIPIGILRVVSGVATLEATGCGTITVSQCAGILSYSRG